MSRSLRLSYAIMASSFIVIGWLDLGTLLLTILFGYFALQTLSFGGHRVLGAALYLIVVVALGCGFFLFSRQAYITVPKIVESTVPAVVNYAEKQGIELPFTDYDSLKKKITSEARDKLANIGIYARRAGFELALLIVGLVAAFSMFVGAKWGADDDPTAVKDSLYATVVRELAARFETFFASFSRVMGAQIIISGINAALTAVFLLWNGFPYALVLIVLCFLFGLLPIIGNLASNTLITGVAFTLSPKMALISLLFLIAIHKLEYFLNSTIIGARTKNPMWLTLIAIVLGEKLMGIPGMVLAPVVLHYIRIEASKNKATEPAPSAPQPAPVESAVSH